MGSNVIALKPHSHFCMDLLTIPLNKWYAFKTKVKEFTSREIARQMIESLHITPIKWSRMTIYLDEYFEGEKNVPKDLEADFEKIKKYFRENNIPPTEWMQIIYDMDSQISPIATEIPISKLVPLVERELKKQ